MGSEFEMTAEPPEKRLTLKDLIAMPDGDKKEEAISRFVPVYMDSLEQIIKTVDATNSKKNALKFTLKLFNSGQLWDMLAVFCLAAKPELRLKISKVSYELQQLVVKYTK